MEKNKQNLKFFYHAEFLKKNSDECYYLIDLTPEDTIRFVVHPHQAGSDLFLGGCQVKPNDLKSVRIVQTHKRIHPEIRSSEKTIPYFMRSNHFFDRSLDVTPRFFQYYVNSPAKKAVTELLAQEKELREEQTKILITGQDDKAKEIDAKTTLILARIAYVIGAFVKGYVEVV